MTYSPREEAQLSKLGAIFKKANSERSRKYRAASAFARPGRCSDRRDKEHLPGGVDKEASRHFLGDAATPPRGDARRGIRLFQNDTSKPHILVSTVLDAPLTDFRKANLDRRGGRDIKKMPRSLL
jgi:hypothetical protein